MTSRVMTVTAAVAAAAASAVTDLNSDHHQQTPKDN